ncbi:uncharacterized protein LOC143557791 [Bidens hawaiensis]|uniref:uncharacterized protein LOC143557791 n=1 Tax=Bidens hawaiensis TaxID=980011 RepID=UPI004049A970
MALLAKWLARYKNDNQSLWVKVITAVHRSSRKWVSLPVKTSIGGTWRIIGNTDKENTYGSLKLLDRLKVRVGLGDKTFFWLDCWAKSQPLKLFPALFSLERQKDAQVVDCYNWFNNELSWNWRWQRQPTSLQQQYELSRCLDLISKFSFFVSPDEWLWSGLDGVLSRFMVKSLRWEIDNFDHQVLDFSFRLNWVPIKVNCFIWKLLMDRIPTKITLSYRGISMGDCMCALCGVTVETSQHLFVKCKVARLVWSNVHDWVKIPKLNYSDSVKELLVYPTQHTSNKEERLAIQSISAVTCWMIWISRNEVIFEGAPFSVSKVVHDIKTASFLWAKHRSNRSSLDWEKWCKFNFVNFPL